MDTCAARSGFACYVYGQALPNEATCECAGTLTAGQSCTDLHSCRPGLECAGTPLQCRRLCSLQLGVTACGTLKCVSLFGSTKWGTCQ